MEAKGNLEAYKNETQRPTNLVRRTFENFYVEVQTLAPYNGVMRVQGAGNPIITLADRVNWKVGQQIVVASTDNVGSHAEQNEIINCTTCAANQLKLKTYFNWTHWGQMENGVDERAEVGLLSRSILIRGRMANVNDTWGAQLRVLRNFTNAHIENAEFTEVGQQIVGSYPIHFHMAFDVDSVGKYTKPAYVKGNSIHKSYNRCVTVHGTMGLLVQNNVAYNTMGHCYFLEDGSEIRNVIDRNLGVDTRYGTVLLSDRDPATCVDASHCTGPATFWIENPNNVITNNAAAGSVAFGIWYIFPTQPTGLSAAYFPNVRPSWTPLGICKNNYAHSAVTGFMVDDGVITDPADPFYLGITGQRYRPHTLPTFASPRVIANFDYVTAHHCRQGIWVRGGDLRVRYGRFADNLVSVTLASEGTSPNDPGSAQIVSNTIFVGITQNNYSTLLGSRVRGFEVYDGPVGAENCTFFRYPANGRNNSAISAKINNPWQIATTNFLTGNVFTDVEKRLYFQEVQKDGDATNIVRDLDGSTGGRKGWSIVKNLPIYQTKSCVDDANFNAYLCPNKYGMVYIYNRNISGTVLNGRNPTVRIVRDEKYAFPLNMTGIGSAQPVTQFQPLVLINRTYTLHFGHPTPPNLGLALQNFDPKDSVRFGICYPSGSSFVVRAKVGGAFFPLPALGSLAALDAVTNSTANTGYFWDNATGLLFVKLIQFNPRDGWNYCGIGGCESVEIVASGPNVGKNAGICSGAYPKYARTEA